MSNIRFHPKQTLGVSHDSCLQLASRMMFRGLAPQVWAEGKFRPSICTSIDTPPGQANKTQQTPLPL